MSTAPAYKAIARALDAHHNATKSGNTEWAAKHLARAQWLVKQHLPSGSGIDSGTKLLDVSTGEKLQFQADFHHMNETGMYSGWTYHRVIVTPSLTAGFRIRITGADRNDIKDYLHSIFDSALAETVREYPDELANQTPDSPAA